MMTNTRPKLEQNLAWFLLILLAAGCLFVMAPFVSMLLWAMILCFSSWPLYQRLLARLGNRRPGDPQCIYFHDPDGHQLQLLMPKE